MSTSAEHRVRIAVPVAQLAHPVALGAQLGRVQADPAPPPRVVAQRVVRVAARGAGRDHVLERVAPVATRCSACGSRPGCRPARPARQGARAGRLDFADPQPHLGRDVGQPERRVHLGLGAAGDGPPVGQVDDPVLAHPQVLAHRQLAELDVVLARAGEVLQQVAVEVLGEHPQVDLQAAGEPDRGLRRALRQHGLGPLPGGEGRDHRFGVRRLVQIDVDVADGRLLAPHAPGRGQVARVRAFAAR